MLVVLVLAVVVLAGFGAGNTGRGLGLRYVATQRTSQLMHCAYGSFPQQGDPNIDLSILQPLLLLDGL